MFTQKSKDDEMPQIQPVRNLPDKGQPLVLQNSVDSPGLFDSGVDHDEGQHGHDRESDCVEKRALGALIRDQYKNG